MVDFPLLSNQVYTSRETIRSNIIEYLKSDLELEGIDLTKTSFVSFMVNLLSVLTANIHFYSSSVYREFFLTQAQIPESIYSLASYLGYSPQSATPASGQVLIVMPLNFEQDNVIVLDRGFSFSAGEVKCSTYYETTITISNTSSGTPSVDVKLYDDVNTRSFTLPVYIDQTSTNICSFLLPVKQYEEESQEFSIDVDLNNYQFVTLDVAFDGKMAGITLYVQEPGSSEELYTQYNSLFLMEDITKGYVVRRTENGARIYFGNGLIGYQPKAGSKIRIIVEKTLGAAGNIISYGVTKGETIYVGSPTGAKALEYSVGNTNPINGGDDEETLEEIRRNAIDYLTARIRMVSENDFRCAADIFPDLNVKFSYPVLKRSDLKTNEIQMFTVLKYGDYSETDPNADTVPTRNIWHSFPSGQSVIQKGTQINFDGTDYYTLFDMMTSIDSDYLAFILQEGLHEVISGDLAATRPIINTGCTYVQGANSLEVYLNGILQVKNQIKDGYDYGTYDEYSTTQVRFNNGVLSPGDLIYFRKTTSTTKDYLYPIDTTNELSIINIESEYIFDEEAELRFYQNGSLVYLKELLNGNMVGTYNIDLIHSSIGFDEGSFQFGDLLRFRTVDSMHVTEYLLSVSSTQATYKTIDLGFISGCGVEVYKNGRLLIPMRLASGTYTVKGDYFRVDNSLMFATGVISNNDVLKIRYFPMEDKYTDRLNELAEFRYIPTTLKVVPTLSSRSTYYPNFKIRYLYIDTNRITDNVNFKLYYDEFSDQTNANCKMTILETNEEIDMTNEYGQYFYYNFTNVAAISVGTLTYEFLITNEDGDLIAKYTINLVLNKELDMYSTMVIDTTSVTIYDIPVVEKSYYDALDLEDFEAYLQTFLQITEWPIYKMLTDNINLKFANTFGKSYAMQANATNRSNIGAFVTDPPDNALTGDRYIIAEGSEAELGNWYEYIGQIIEWNGDQWIPTKALTDDIIYDSNTEIKYIFNGSKWIEMIFDIPIKIELEVFKNISFVGSDSQLAEDIKTALLNEFSSRFGINVKLYTSEIVKVVQSVTGVQHCNLINPKHNIFFDAIDLKLLTEDQLLEFAPDFVYFSSDSINITILQGV